LRSDGKDRNVYIDTRQYLVSHDLGSGEDDVEDSVSVHGLSAAILSEKAGKISFSIAPSRR
jgi:hypothetical protein